MRRSITTDWESALKEDVNVKPLQHTELDCRRTIKQTRTYSEKSWIDIERS